MNDIKEITASSSDAGKRLDSFISESFDVSRSLAARYIESSDALVNGAASNKKYKVTEGDVVTLALPEPVECSAEPEDIPLDVVYEDADIIVINKPTGMVVHPAHGNESGTLVNALMFHCKDSLSGIGGELRPGIVHRIDKDTSGLLVCAKNDRAHLSLSEQIKVHSARRVYHAIAVGNFKEDEGTVDAPIGRHPVDRKKMAVYKKADPDAHVREAVTHYRVLERFGQYTYLELVLETGRTHQIRVHLSSLGHRLLGDEVYGTPNTPFEKKNARLLSGQVLHAKELHLTHPATDERMTFTTPLPADFEIILSKLRAERDR
jgi:23S rRNA pseudouridine1911/1915/1917 synthase